jgi:hypothetical protein
MHRVSIILGYAVLLLLMNMPNTARAGIEACGDIDVEANATCEVKSPGISCEAECKPVTMELACAARLEVECEGGCNASAKAECDTGCLKDCLPKCTVDPGKFECSATCKADCSGQCQAKCQSSGDKTSCSASCKATCSASCDASCDIEKPDIDCDNDCAASCKGACKAEANLDCQIECQNKSFATCQATLEGGCEADCKAQQGALFCDGQYVDHDDNLKKCVDALRAMVDVKGSAEGSCSNGTCTGKANAEASCDIGAFPGHSTRYSGWTVALALLGLALVTRRNRKTVTSLVKD